VILILLLLSLGLWAVYRTDRRSADLVAVQHTPVGIMGTVSKLVLVTGSHRSQEARQDLQAAESELRRQEALLSTWIDSSPVSRFNAAGSGQPLMLPDELVAVLDLARRLHQETRGTFDITARPVVELWRRAAERGVLPSEHDLRHARASSTWEQIQMGPAGIVKARPSTRVDIDGIAKGWAIDRAVERLQRSGAPGGMVEVGGDLRSFGSGPGGRPWTVAVRSPFADEVWAEIEVTEGAVCSSGDYARFSTIAGRRFGHIIDPRTGWPTEATRAVTVVGPDAATADAWATALSILGVEGLDLLTAGRDLEALIVTGTPAAFRVTVTPGLGRRLVRTSFDWVAATEPGG
jgi:thiamine biosynthesis lipoprotein